MSALFRWPCSISIHLSPRSVTVISMHLSPVCRCWCPPFSAGHVIHFSGLSLLVSALYRWPCSMSMRLSPRSVAAGVRCHWWCPPFSAGHVTFLFICLPGLSLLVSAFFCWPCSMSACLFICLPRSVTADVRLFSAGDATFLFICLPGLSLVVSAPGHVAFLFICLPGLSLLASALFRWPI